MIFKFIGLDDCIFYFLFVCQFWQTVICVIVTWAEAPARILPSIYQMLRNKVQIASILCMFCIWTTALHVPVASFASASYDLYSILRLSCFCRVFFRLRPRVIFYIVDGKGYGKSSFFWSTSIFRILVIITAAARQSSLPQFHCLNCCCLVCWQKINCTHAEFSAFPLSQVHTIAYFFVYFFRIHSLWMEHIHPVISISPGHAIM